MAGMLRRRATQRQRRDIRLPLRPWPSEMTWAGGGLVVDRPTSTVANGCGRPSDHQVQTTRHPLPVSKGSDRVQEGEPEGTQLDAVAGLQGGPPRRPAVELQAREPPPGGEAL